MRVCVLVLVVGVDVVDVAVVAVRSGQVMGVDMCLLLLLHLPCSRDLSYSLSLSLTMSLLLSLLLLTLLLHHLLDRLLVVQVAQRPRPLHSPSRKHQR